MFHWSSLNALILAFHPIPSHFIPVFPSLSTGVLLLGAAQSEDVDVLWGISPDPFPFQSPLKEMQVSQSVSQSVSQPVCFLVNRGVYLSL